MQARASPVVRAGLLGGALFYLHGLLPNRHAYPLLWPLLGGALALIWVAGRSSERVPLLRTVAIGLGAGAVAGALASATLAPTYLFLTTDAGGPLARLLGAQGPIPYSPTALGGLLLVMLLAIPASLAGSAVARPFARVGRRR